MTQLFCYNSYNMQQWSIYLLEEYSEFKFLAQLRFYCISLELFAQQLAINWANTNNLDGVTRIGRKGQLYSVAASNCLNHVVFVDIKHSIKRIHKLVMPSNTLNTLNTYL